MPSSNRRSSDEDKTRKYNMKNAKKEEDLVRQTKKI